MGIAGYVSVCVLLYCMFVCTVFLADKRISKKTPKTRRKTAQEQNAIEKHAAKKAAKQNP
jgi:hypothetical protein